VLGSRATAFADPGATAARNQSSVYGANSSNSTVQNNLIGFGRTSGVYLDAGATGWAVTGNEIVDCGRFDNVDGDGITINTGATNTVTGNVIRKLQPGHRRDRGRRDRHVIINNTSPATAWEP